MGIGAKQKVVLICHVNIKKGKNEWYIFWNTEYDLGNKNTFLLIIMFRLIEDLPRYL